MADIGSLDLNLLRVFDAVARERHVTRAAERLHLSQPAVSNALARLRHALGDELFLRRPGGVEPTALALSLAQPVAEALDRIAEAISAQAPFDPAITDRVFPVAFSEYAEAVLAPPLLARMQREAAGALLAIRHADRTIGKRCWSRTARCSRLACCRSRRRSTPGSDCCRRPSAR
ncbi:LysR family transcriptional regulator [Siccirubricoccus deserti]